MKEGAFHYVPSPSATRRSSTWWPRRSEKRRLVAENRALKARLDAGNEFPEMVGHSAPMEKVFQTIRQAAPARSTILVTGESGTGKEARRAGPPPPLAARLGPVRHGPLGRAPARPLGVEPLRPHAGAFTGAVAEKKGLFRVADGGTIFFDEIGTVPLETQAKLLRVLQEREFLPVGAVEPIRSDVRVVAATNADLGGSWRRGSSGGPLLPPLRHHDRPPPLRERKEDIPLLVETLVSRAAARTTAPSRPSPPRR